MVQALQGLFLLGVRFTQEVGFGLPYAVVIVVFAVAHDRAPIVIAQDVT